MLQKELELEQQLQQLQIVIIQDLKVHQGQHIMQHHDLLQDITDLQVQIRIQVEVRVFQDQHILQIRMLHQVLVQVAHIIHEHLVVLLTDHQVARIL